MKEYTVPANRFKGFYHFNEISSTMDEAEKFIEKGVRRGIVLADSQIGGYGRNSKSWFSPDNGNIYMSFFEMIDHSSQFGHIPQRTALSAFYAIKSFVTDGTVRIKWPNDILIDMKKVAGIIAKNIQRNDSRFFICGMGINVFLPDCSQFGSTWSVGSICEKNPSATTQKVLEAVITETDFVFDLDEKEVTERFNREISWMIGKSIHFSQDGKTNEEGTVTGFNQDGSMIKISGVSGEIEISTASITNIL